MSDRRTLKVTPLNDLEVALTRDFHAPRQLVFDALTKPELIRQWLGIHGSWQWVVCDVDLRVGGTYRYLWRNAKGKEMGMGGRFVEIVAPERLVNTELFDDPWYEGEGLATAVLTERDGWTTLTTRTRVFCPDRATRRRMLPYWTIIRPASGFIRGRMLRQVKRRAEGAPAPA